LDGAYMTNNNMTLTDLLRSSLAILPWRVM